MKGTMRWTPSEVTLALDKIKLETGVKSDADAFRILIRRSRLKI